MEVVTYEKQFRIEKLTSIIKNNKEATWDLSFQNSLKA